MPRPRVLSFMSQWKDGGHPPRSPTAATTPDSPTAPQVRQESAVLHSPTTEDQIDRSVGQSPIRRRRDPVDRPPSRPNSILANGYQPPLMEIAKDTPPELQPIFAYLNSHSNKLYQEGYFLKLHDLDSRGRPSSDRVWNECFAQLVGTVLSLWDAAQLDAAGEDGEVIPTFINLTDASIKMIESLPMNGVDGQSLQNVLSISTAANNRYLLHFNSLHSLTQWTAGIRLAIFEYATLQEAYTGSIIAGKGKYLNNIRTIMERSRYPSGDWARVRFGAGTPWRRCWCVITPPGEKEMHKAVKREKKRSAYDQSVLPVTGDIKFYENRKITKKSKPIATITNAFSAYAIYPQSKPLIDQSTLVKVEGFITIHSTPESTTEGFVFVMPEVHPAVTGFEMMLRWMLPVFDTFGLYGRPSRLIADVLDTRSLMFAMPTQRRYGYLELIDVAGLIHTEGSQKWNEREWRKQMKALTSKRMTTASLSPKEVGGSMGSRRGEGRSSLNLPASLSRSSLNLPARNGIKFTDDNLVKSSPSSRRGSPAPTGENGAVTPPRRVDSAPPDAGSFVQSRQHHRSVSDAHGYKRQVEPSPLLFEQHASEEQPPLSSQYVIMPDTNGMGDYRTTQEQYSDPNADHWSEQSGSTSEREYGSQINGDVLPRVEALGADDRTLNPVEAPPIMAHGSGEKPRTLPNQMPDLRRANLAIDDATLAQLADANRESNANHGLVNPQLFGNTNANMMINSKYQPSLNHMTNGYYPSPNQPMSSAYQPPPNSTMYSYQPQPNMYQSSPNSYQPPTNYSMIQVPRQRGGPSQDRRLPTIPGTPAFEPNQFDLPVMERTVQEPMQRPDQPIMHRTTSSGSISRRTVPSQIIQEEEEEER